MSHTRQHVDSTDKWVWRAHSRISETQQNGERARRAGPVYRAGLSVSYAPPIVPGSTNLSHGVAKPLDAADDTRRLDAMQARYSATYFEEPYRANEERWQAQEMHHVSNAPPHILRIKHPAKDFAPFFLGTGGAFAQYIERETGCRVTGCSSGSREIVISGARGADCERAAILVREKIAAFGGDTPRMVMNIPKIAAFVGFLYEKKSAGVNRLMDETGTRVRKSAEPGKLEIFGPSDERCLRTAERIHEKLVDFELIARAAASGSTGQLPDPLKQEATKALALRDPATAALAAAEASILIQSHQLHGLVARTNLTSPRPQYEMEPPDTPPVQAQMQEEARNARKRALDQQPYLARQKQVPTSPWMQQQITPPPPPLPPIFMPTWPWARPTSGGDLRPGLIGAPPMATVPMLAGPPPMAIAPLPPQQVMVPPPTLMPLERVHEAPATQRHAPTTNPYVSTAMRARSSSGAALPSPVSCGYSCLLPSLPPVASEEGGQGGGVPSQQAPGKVGQRRGGRPARRKREMARQGRGRGRDGGGNERQAAQQAAVATEVPTVPSDTRQECCVCFGTKEEGTLEWAALVPCGHVLCFSCAATLPTCPTCKATCQLKLKLYL